MPSDSPRQIRQPIAAEAEENTSDAHVSIVIVVTLASLFAAHAASQALAFTRDGAHALEIVVPATILGAVEAWMSPSSNRAKASGNAEPQREQRFLAAGRGALLGAALGVLTDALGEKGIPALARVLAAPLGRLILPSGAPLNEFSAAACAWGLTIGVALLIGVRMRALRRTARQHPE